VGSVDPRGVLSLAIQGVEGSVDGIAVHVDTTRRIDAEGTGSGVVDHPNGVTGIDHMVVMTPDCERTIAALALIGLESRRVRRFEVDGVTRRQTFFWLGDVILELVGPESPSGTESATVWGLALTSTDLDRTATFLGRAGGPPKRAVQTDRLILTVKTQDLDISTKLAIMSPHDSSPWVAR
jgi:hypothetical protein